MTFFLLNVLLALAWMALTGIFGPGNLFIGFLLGYITLWMTQRHRPSPYFRKLVQVIGLVAFFAWEVVKANLRVAMDVVTPHPRMTPGIVAVPLDAETDAEITLFANLITLTPGTLSLDVSKDRRVLYIHAMYIRDVEDFKKGIKDGLERRLLEVLR